MVTVDGDIEQDLRRAVLAARDGGGKLRIVGGGSKAFYGRPVTVESTPLYTRGHHGVVHYDPAELVLTARAGTKLATVEELLAGENQMLGFEPPHFGDGDGDGVATLGGAIAAGLAGPRRPFTGGVRDFVLGVKLMNAGGEVMRFGGEVMKNVAGFDLARLMAGALGTLGLLLEISLRVLPRPAVEQTLRLQHATPAAAVALFNRLAARPLPLSAAAWCGGETRIRLSGSAAGVACAAEVVGGDVDPGGGEFWRRLREHELPFFRGDGGGELLRVSLPPASQYQLRDAYTPTGSDADPPHRRVARHRARPHRRRHPARVRPLRFLQRHLPDLPTARRRVGRPARAHLSDETIPRRRQRRRRHARASRPMFAVPQLREHLPVGRRIRPAV